MNHNSHLLPEQLAELEELFATSLTSDITSEELATIWKKIKELRLELNEPIYGEVITGNEKPIYKTIPE
jgi:hypothetical protein